MPLIRVGLMRMRAWFVLAVIATIVAGFGYLAKRSDLCAWVNETPSPDGCAELFTWWALPAAGVIPGALVLIIGLAVTLSGPRTILVAFAAYAGLVVLVFFLVTLLIVHPMRSV